MTNEIKYMTLKVQSYPFGWDIKYFYLPVQPNLNIGDILTTKDGKQYQIIDGKTQVNFQDIDLKVYHLFEEITS